MLRVAKGAGSLDATSVADPTRTFSQVKKALLVQPLAAFDQFIVHEGNMGRRPAKGSHAKFKEEKDDLG